jgi:predicted secreted protein
MASPSSNTHPLGYVSEALATAVEQVGQGVVAVFANRHGPASGVVWRLGVRKACRIDRSQHSSNFPSTWRSFTSARFWPG